MTSLFGDGSSVKQVDSLIDKGKLEEASGALEKSALDVDHVYAEKTSDARLCLLHSRICRQEDCPEKQLP